MTIEKGGLNGIGVTLWLEWKVVSYPLFGLVRHEVEEVGLFGVVGFMRGVGLKKSPKPGWRSLERYKTGFISSAFKPILTTNNSQQPTTKTGRHQNTSS